MNYIQKVQEVLSKKIDVEDELLDLYTLLVLVRGEDVSWENVHDAWAIWKNRINADHPALIPFSELSQEKKELDKEYTDAIAATHKELAHYSP